MKQATPKYAFIAWLAARDRLSTLDRIAKWSQGIVTTYVLSNSGTESRNHIFFECCYSAQIWEKTVKGVMGSSYTKVWSEIMELIIDRNKEKKWMFCIRYAFQLVLYVVWRERNKVRHGDKLLPLTVVQKMIDKGIRNKISVLRRKGIKGMDVIMQFWFSTRLANV